MKRCLLCGKKVETDTELQNHYLSFHKVDPSNAFFKKLFNECANRVLNKNCTLCGDFLTTLNYKKAHNFVKYYEEGKETLVEDKPLDIVKTLNIVKYQISYSKHSDYYNFSNSEQVINEFLTNVKLHFRAGGPVQIKASFTIENYRPSVSEDHQPLYNTRYWTTDVYPADFFNSFVYYNLRQNISKRVISNGLSGSFWLFSRFLNLNVSVYKNTSKLVL